MVDKTLNTTKIKWFNDGGTARLCDVLIDEYRPVDWWLVVGNDEVVMLLLIIKMCFRTGPARSACGLKKEKSLLVGRLY
jgi:hypothetical protein